MTGSCTASQAPTKNAGRPGPSLCGEYGNIGLLLILYTLQGIPMGLFGFVNMTVKSIFAGSFSEQGTFMLAAWPFSLKLFWAPLVDSCYSENFGRRKTWMVPAQLAIGLVLLYLASVIETLFETKAINSLTTIFFLLYFFCATQDIAVDGWALTMLRPENAGYASTCNAIGQTVGFSIGFMVPMSRLFLLGDFIFFWGTVFVATTLAVWVLKREEPTQEDEQIEGLKDAYLAMFRVIRLRPVQQLAFHLITRSLAFIPADVMAIGKLQDSGFPKESIATIKLAVTPLEIILPWLLSRFTAGPKPLSIVALTYIPRVLLTPLACLLVYVVGDIPATTPAAIYASVFVFTVLQGVSSNAMFVAHMAFFAKVSDPAIGGTYMTFLNTVHNLGNMWASTFCLKAADHIRDSTGLDGFSVLCAACAIFGVLWFIFMRPVLHSLEDGDIATWRAS